MRVMHVTDSMNGGVSAAIIDVARANPQQEHILLWRTKPDSPEPSEFELTNTFQSEYRLKSSLLLSILQLRRLAIQLKPEIIHLHSSKAGFIGRVIPFSSRVFYSSHGFGFQRTDVPKIFRNVFLKIELALCKRTETYVAFWPLDYDLAKSVLKYKHVSFYGTALLREFPTLVPPSRIGNEKIFITTARLAKAKDPLFLVRALQLMDLQSNSYFHLSNAPKFVWIGRFGNENGNLKLSIKMRKAGIDLVPWKKPEHLNQELSLAEATIITSAWESGPMTFYESLLAGTPVLMRDIAAVSMYVFCKYDSPESLKNGILKHMLEPSYRETALHEQIQAVNDYFERQPLTYSIYN